MLDAKNEIEYLRDTKAQVQLTVATVAIAGVYAEDLSPHCVCTCAILQVTLGKYRTRLRKS